MLAFRGVCWTSPKLWFLESQLAPTLWLSDKCSSSSTFVGKFSQRLDLSGKFCDKNRWYEIEGSTWILNVFVGALFFGWLNSQPNPSKYFGLLRSKKSGRTIPLWTTLIQLFRKVGSSGIYASWCKSLIGETIHFGGCPYHLIIPRFYHQNKPISFFCCF